MRRVESCKGMGCGSPTTASASMNGGGWLLKRNSGGYGVGAKRMNVGVESLVEVWVGDTERGAVGLIGLERCGVLPKGFGKGGLGRE